MKPRFYPRSLFTAPASEPISPQEIAAHCRLNATSAAHMDVAIAYGIAAREHVEDVSGRQLMTAAWDVYPPCFPVCNKIVLPLGKLQSITSFTFTDSSLATTSWSVNSGNLLDENSAVVAHIDTISDPGKIVLAYGAIWPAVVLKTSNPIAIRMTCGYGEANAVHEVYKQAMRLLIGHWNENREGTTIGTLMMSDELKLGVKAILGPKRIYGF